MRTIIALAVSTLAVVATQPPESEPVENLTADVGAFDDNEPSTDSADASAEIQVVTTNDPSGSETETTSDGASTAGAEEAPQDVAGEDEAATLADIIESLSVQQPVDSIDLPEYNSTGDSLVVEVPVPVEVVIVEVPASDQDVLREFVTDLIVHVGAIAGEIQEQIEAAQNDELALIPDSNSTTTIAPTPSVVPDERVAPDANETTATPTEAPADETTAAPEPEETTASPTDAPADETTAASEPEETTASPTDASADATTAAPDTTEGQSI